MNISRIRPIVFALTLALALGGQAALAPQAQAATPIWGQSPITEPYPYVDDEGGGFTGTPQPYSPDPLVDYRWDTTSASDNLEIFLRTPQTATTDTPASFSGLNSLTTSSPNVTVSGTGTIMMDFGTEFAGWLEIDSPDLTGTVTLGVSEYNAPMKVNSGPANPSKTKAGVKYGNTYRLELNSELYEGVRFGFINVTSFSSTFHITGVRLVCQTKPVNYEGSFDSDNALLNKIWYTAAYDVRANLKKDYFAAILVDRGDRYSWTGDAYPAQAAALPAFANYDFVLSNLTYTSTRSNGIESYELYWIFSLVDYYRYSGDAAGVRSLLSQATSRLDHAYSIWGTNPGLSFFGWDERLGAGFEQPNIAQNQLSYKLLSINAWKQAAQLFTDLGETTLATRYAGYAQAKTAEITADPNWADGLALHSSGDAINAGVADDATTAELFDAFYRDRTNRMSYSSFNEWFLIQAMAKAGEHDEAIATILDHWGGQVTYGGTTFFETYRPEWNNEIGANDPVPNNQAGYTSLAHPWGAGVLTWLTEETLGVKPVKAGFEEFSVTPHLGTASQLSRVSGTVPTPHGNIVAAFDTTAGTASLTVPAGTTAQVGIPKAGKAITGLLVDGQPYSTTLEDDDFVYVSELAAGSHTFTIGYEGQGKAFTQGGFEYAAEFVGTDSTTQGSWGGVYGSEGAVIWAPGQLTQLPSYVASVSQTKAKVATWSASTSDPRALSLNGSNTGTRAIGTLYSQDPVACYQTFTFDIALKADRPYTVALYFVDYDWTAGSEKRQVAVEMFDAKTLDQVAPTKVVSDYEGGKYLIYRYDKSVRFRIDQMRGANATLSGVFFGEGASTIDFSGGSGSGMKYDETDPSVAFSGTWSQNQTMSGAYNGMVAYSNQTGAYVEFPFTGTGVSIIASKENNRGKMLVYLDGVARAWSDNFATDKTADLYSATTLRQQEVWAADKLVSGPHVVRVTVPGTKNAASSGVYVDIDAFEVRDDAFDGRIDDQSGALTFTGTWTNDPMPGAYAGTFSYSNSTSASAEYTFTGTSIKLLSSLENNRGIAEILIDGTPVGTADMYAATAQRTQEVFSIDSLAAGTHTITVRPTGTKNAAASAAYIDIDAFEVPTAGGSVTGDAEPPAISGPKGAEYRVGDTATALQVSAGAINEGTLSYQWYSNSTASVSGATAISGATSSSYTPPTSAAGTVYYFVEVTNTNTAVSGNQTGVNTSKVVAVTVNPASTASVTGTRDPSQRTFERGTTTAQLGDALPKHVAVELSDSTVRVLPVTWDTTGFDGNTTAIYTLPGTLTLDADVTNPGSVKAGINVEITGDPPVVIASVAILGTAATGETLTASPTGVVPGDADLAYEWLSNGNVVGTASTYVLRPSDVGRSVTVKVTASKTGYADTSLTSAAVVPVLGAASIASVGIGGTAQAGQTVNAEVGGVVPGNATLSYEWKIGGTTVGTGSSYDVQIADIGQSLTVTVTGTRFGYQTSSTTSAPVTVAAMDGTIASVAITGKVRVGFTVAAEVGAVSPADAVLAYDWQLGGVTVGTSPTYPIQPADDGGSLTVTVTATKTGYAIPPVTSAARVVGAVDKSDLQDAVDEAGALAAGDYTTSSWSDLQDVVADAQGVLADGSATQAQVDTAETDVDNAIAALIPRGNPAELQSAVNALAGLAGDLSGYTDASAQAFTDALQDAQDRLAAAADSSQAQFDAATVALFNAAGQLAVKPPLAPLIVKDVLNAAVTSADGKTSADYTAASWKPVQDALTVAKQVLANVGATQAQVDKATTDLVKALGALQPKPAATVNTDITKPVPSGKQAVVTKVKFGQSSVTIAKGKSFLLRPGVYYTKGTPNYTTGVSYTSSNPKVAKVDKYGQVKALKAGTAKIIATTTLANAKGKKLSTYYTVKVVKKVSKAKVKAVSLPKLPKTMKVGQVLWLTGKYTNASTQQVRITYSTKRFRIATIDQAGRLIALNKGKEIVTVKAGGKTKKYTITVK